MKNAAIAAVVAALVSATGGVAAGPSVRDWIDAAETHEAAQDEQIAELERDVRALGRRTALQSYRIQALRADVDRLLVCAYNSGRCSR